MSDWVNHCKAYSKKNNCTYKEAMSQARSSYKAGAGIGRKIDNGIKKLKNTKDMHYGRNINNFVQESNRISQKYVKPIVQHIPVVKQAANLALALQDVQAKASDEIYTKTRKPTSTGGMIRPCPNCGGGRRRPPVQMTMDGGALSNNQLENGSTLRSKSGVQTVASNLFYDPASLIGNIEPSLTERMYGVKKGGSFSNLRGGSFTNFNYER